MRFTPALRAIDWLVARPIAHRGLHDASLGIMENTAAAFDAAIANRYAIECDLQISRDGEAMVFHDYSLRRMAGIPTRLKALTAAELQKVPFIHGDCRMQRLAELLDQVGGKVPLVIEIKSEWNGSEALTLRALKVLEPYRGPYCIMSFDPDVVATLRREQPRTIRGIVADRTNDPEYRMLPVVRRLELRHLSHLGRSDPHFVSFYWRDLPWPPVGAVHRTGKPVICWTIRSQADAAKARRYCDQITFENFRP